MTFAEFRAAFAEMTSVYGDKAYPQAMSQKLFHHVSKIDAQDFRRIIDNVILEHNRAPTIGVVLKACYPFTKMVREREQQKAVKALEERSGRCQVCDANGMVFMFLRADPAKEFAFRCMACDAATVRHVWGGLPPWQPELSADYITLAEKTAGEVTERLARRDVEEAEKKVRRAAIAAEIEQMRREGAARPTESEDLGQWGF